MLPSQGLRDSGSKISLGLPEPGDRREKNESSVDSSRERNAARPRAQQVDLIASVQPSAKSSPSPPPSKQPSAPTSPSPPPAAPVLAKMTSSLARGALPYEPQVPSRGAPFESPHPSGEGRGKAPPDEQSRMNSLVTSRGLPFAKPSSPSPPPLKQPSASTSPLPPPAAPVLAKMASNRARGALPYEPQVPSRGTPFESPHPSGGDRGKAPPDEQSRMNSSVTPRGLPLPTDNRAAAATGPPSQPQPVSASRPLEKSNSRLIGSEGVPREAKQATEGPTSDRKERKGAAVLEEYETRSEDSATGSDGAKRRKAEPNPPTSFMHKQAPAESLVERTYSSSKPSRGDDFGTPHSETGKSRGKVVQSSDPAPSLGMKETHFTRPPPAPTQNQPKPDIGVPPKGNSIGVTPFSTQGQHKPNVESTRVVLPPPLSQTPSVAEGRQIPTISSGKSPRFSLP